MYGVNKYFCFGGINIWSNAMAKVKYVAIA
jgi:hypothetical protein